MGDFKKLHVWRKAHALALSAHRVSTKMRGGSVAALRNQMTRAAMSIPTNIVEGRGQRSEKDFARFLRYAANSTAELEYHLIVARDLEIISRSDGISLLAQAVEVRKMLHGLITKLEAASAKRPRGESTGATPPSATPSGDPNPAHARSEPRAAVAREPSAHPPSRLADDEPRQRGVGDPPGQVPSP